jgi:hypothetical protein
MGSLQITLKNARRMPLDDIVEVRITDNRTNTLTKVVRGRNAARPFTVAGLPDGRSFVLQVFPARHRPVGAIVVTAQGGGTTPVELFSPLDPSRVVRVTFPKYGALPPDLRDVLDRSTLESGAHGGQIIYEGLADVERAGLLNLYAKMESVGFDAATTVWSAVSDIYRVRPDRLFVNVDPWLRDRVKGAVVEGRFHQVDESLHTPPPGFDRADSFKTEDPFGNLQLSFFSSVDAPIRFKVDADIDDAAGIGHAFQVVRNFATHGTTHPYDIHEILVFRQDVVPGYDLA